MYQKILDLLNSEEGVAVEVICGEEPEAWVYYASDGVPTVYFDFYSLVRLTEHTFEGRDDLSLQVIPVCQMVQHQKDRVKTYYRKMSKYLLNHRFNEDKQFLRVTYNKKPHWIIGATMTDEDMYWVICDATGKVELTSAVGKLNSTDNSPLPKEIPADILERAGECLRNKIADCCDIIIWGPFKEV